MPTGLALSVCFLQCLSPAQNQILLSAKILLIKIKPEFGIKAPFRYPCGFAWIIGFLGYVKN
jgi:hypothetical protein